MALLVILVLILGLPVLLILEQVLCNGPGISPKDPSERVYRDPLDDDDGDYLDRYASREIDWEDVE